MRCHALARHVEIRQVKAPRLHILTIGRRPLLLNKKGPIRGARVLLAACEKEVPQRQRGVVGSVAEIGVASEQLRTGTCLLPNRAAYVRDSKVKSRLRA